MRPDGGALSFEYRDRVAIVTGASSGIGRAIALDLAGRGVTIVGVARRAGLLAEVIESCRRAAPNSTAVVADVGDRDAVERFCAEALERYGKVDVLVNNAGIPMRVHVARLTVEDVERVMRINYMSTIYATLALLPSMLERRDGRIVNVASVAGRVGSPREGAYTASKFAMSGWSEVLAADLDGTGVQVHLIHPGPIKTEIWDKVEEPAAYEGRFYSPHLVADAVRRCLERGDFERWVPERLALLPLARAIAPKRFVKGLARYDRRAARRRGRVT